MQIGESEFFLEITTSISWSMENKCMIDIGVTGDIIIVIFI